MKNMVKKLKSLSLITIIATTVFSFNQIPIDAQDQVIDSQGFSVTSVLPSSAPEVPEGATYVEVNDNIPYFTNEDITQTSPWVEFSLLDELGRVGAANAVLSTDLMPAEEDSRDDVSAVLPTGWVQGKYDQIDSGGWLYNRAHLIGHQLIGDGIPELNLMTGTRWFNVDGMLPFENFVAATIEDSDLTVRYRVTPYFEEGNRLASGVFMEGFSIEDNGETLQFNIYVPNIQPGVGIDYGTGNHANGNIQQTATNSPSNDTHPGTTLYYSANNSNGTSTTNNTESNTSNSTPSTNNNATTPPVTEEPVVQSEPETVITEEPVEPQESVYYKNCTIARESGAAPVYEGDPGYGKHLDRDGDGIGCE